MRFRKIRYGFEDEEKLMAICDDCGKKYIFDKEKREWREEKGKKKKVFRINLEKYCFFKCGEKHGFPKR